MSTPIQIDGITTPLVNEEDLFDQHIQNPRDDTNYPDFSDITIHPDEFIPINTDITDDSFKDDPPIPIRQHKTDFDCEKDEVLFELKDVTIVRDELIEEEDIELYGDVRSRKEVVAYLHGNLITGETVCVQFRGYKPYFYLTIPEHQNEEGDQRWVKQCIEELKKNKELPFRELESANLVYLVPTTGFRNRKPYPIIKFRFHTMNAYYRFKVNLTERFPPPKDREIEKGVYRNDIMLCEHNIPHEIKFCNYYSLSFSGWVKLSPGTYSYWLKGKRAIHNFWTMSVEGVDRDKLSESLALSLDVEAIRADGEEAMPDATNPNDYTACIGNVIESTNKSFPRRHYCFTWGGSVDIPTVDRKGKPLPKRDVILKIYKDEASMLTHWVRWLRSQNISPDVIIGWNIYGFDLGWIITRIHILPGIPEDAKEWGRLIGYSTKPKSANIESKAISYSEYTLTPSPGIIFVDSLIVFQRDVTLRLPDYQLKTVAKHFLGEEKDDVHYSEIRPLFEGNAQQRGLLIAYNMQDCDLVMNLFFKCAHWPKMSNVCSVNKVPMNMLCPRGQQIRVFAGLHKNALDKGYFVYRPWFDPTLDEPIVEDPTLWSEEEEKAENRFENKSDTDKMMEYWMKKLSLLKEKPKFSIISFDESGKKNEKEIDSNLVSIDFNSNVVTIKQSNVNISNCKLYGKDVNPFSNINNKKKEEKKGFVTRDGRSIEEIEKLSRVRHKRKFIPTDNGTCKVVDIIGKNKKRKNEEERKMQEEESEKGFAGGFVMEPKSGFYENVPVLDFNSLYPNIMMSYCLDPALLVLDPKFANCPGVTYLRIRFNAKKEFLFAQGIPGVMIEHTRNLVNSRKVAQAVMGTCESRVEYIRKEIIKLLQLSDKLKFEDVVKKTKEYIDMNILPGESINQPLAIQVYERMLDYEYGILAEIMMTGMQTLNGSISEYLNKEYVKKHPNIAAFISKQSIEQVSENEIKSVISKSSILSKDIQYTREEISKAARDYENHKEERIKKCIAKCRSVISDYESKITEWKQSVESTDDPNRKCMLALTLLQLGLDHEADVSNFNSKQNELKVTGNSTFGFQGAGGKPKFKQDGTIYHKAMMQIMPVSACVTYIGRKTIEASRDLVEKEYPGAQVIYADTDSLFILFPENIIPKGIEGLNKTFVVAKEVADKITKLFSFPGSSMRIVHEKSCRFIIIYSAKCYALDKYMKPYPEDPGKLEIKGMTPTKRDCPQFIANICKTALNKILKQGKLEEAKQYVRDTLMDFVEDRIRGDEISKIKEKLFKYVEIYIKDMSKIKDVQEAIFKISTKPVEQIDDIAKIFMDELVKIKFDFLKEEDYGKISQELKDFIDEKIRLEKVKIYKKLSKASYGDEGCNKVSHAQLAQVINKRKPGLGPKSGESVQYVFVDYGLDAKQKHNQKIFSKMYVKCGDGYIEDYSYVLENKLKVDKLLYLQKQATSNITLVFKPLMEKPESLLEEAIREQTRKQFGVKKGADLISKLKNMQSSQSIGHKALPTGGQEKSISAITVVDMEIL